MIGSASSQAQSSEEAITKTQVFLELLSSQFAQRWGFVFWHHPSPLPPPSPRVSGEVAFGFFPHAEIQYCTTAFAIASGQFTPNI